MSSSRKSWKRAKKLVNTRITGKLKDYVQFNENLGPKIEEYENASESKKGAVRRELEAIIRKYDTRIRNSSLQDNAAEHLLIELSHIAGMIGSDMRIQWKREL